MNQIKHIEFIKHNIKFMRNNGTKKGADDAAIARRKQDEIIIKHWPTKNEHAWANINKDKFKKKLTDNKSLYEVICSYPYKIYFDVDGDGLKTPANYMQITLDTINELFKDADIAVSGSETDIKKSYHIILNNYLIHNDIERDKLKALVISLKIKNDGFDTLVYNHKRNMKAVNQGKEDGRIQAIIINDDIEKHIITAFFNNDTKTINDIKFIEPIQAPKKIKEVKNKIEPVLSQNDNIDVDNTYIIKLLKVIYKSKDDNRTEFFKIGCLVKSLKLPFDVWYDLSKTSKHFQSGTYNYLLDSWNNIKYCGYGVGALKKWARDADIDEFNKIMIEAKLTEPEKIKEGVIEIDKRYLLNNELKLNDTDNIITSSIKKLFTDDKIKSLNLRSPYGTGKTQLMKEIFKTYNKQRILCISHRISLTTVLLSEYNNFGFKSYQDEGAVHSDKLIIQIESLLRIEDDFGEMPSYDIILLDEIESILNQFNSSMTFKNNERKIYEYFEKVIEASLLKGGKIISLDGDLAERAYTFLEHFGEQINIKNIVNFNTKTINIVNDGNVFNKLLYEHLDANKKIIMPCMSEAAAIYYEDAIKQKYPKLSVQKYTGKTGQEEKAKLKNIVEEWSQLDVIIYTPTIEAGVSFDVERFDIIFGIIADNVASQRSYFQMMSRVRQFKDDNIYLLNMNSCKINNCCLESYESYKQGLLETKDIVLNISYKTIGDKIIKEYGDRFDNLYCFNKIEEINKRKNTFLLVFKKIALQKGFKFNIIEKEEEAEVCKDKPTAETTINKILETPDITVKEYRVLCEKQKRIGISEAEQYLICKIKLKQDLGVDILDYDIIHKFNKKGFIEHYLSLVDIENIDKDKEKNDRALAIRKIIIIKDFLERMGWDNILNENKIKTEDLNKLLMDDVKNNTAIFNNDKINKMLFTTQNKKLNTFKGILGYINTILKNYALKISLIQEREEGEANKVNYYRLETLHGITDIIKLRYLKNKIFVDGDGLFMDHNGELHDTNFKTWGHLKIIDNGDIFENIDNSDLDIGIDIS